MPIKSKCLAFLLLGSSKLGAALRSTDLDSVKDELDDLKVLYKYCFGQALTQAIKSDSKKGQHDSGKFINDGEDYEFNVQSTWLTFRLSDFSCNLELTNNAADKFEVDVADQLGSAEAVSIYKGYGYRPDKTWFEIADDPELQTALKNLYVSSWRNKQSGFYARNWEISGECEGRQRCEELIKTGEGAIKFTAVMRATNGGDAVHMSGNNDGEVILPASEIKTSFEPVCKKAFTAWKSAFVDVVDDVCSGAKYFRPDKLEGKDTLSWKQ